MFYVFIFFMYRDGVMGEVEAHLRALLTSKPEYRMWLKKIIAKEEELDRRYPNNPDWRVWEVGDVGVPPWVVMKLLHFGIVERTYASSSHRYYRLVDRATVKRVLQEFERGGKPSEGAGRVVLKTHTDLKPIKLPRPEEMFHLVVGYDDYKWIMWKGIRKWLKGSKPAHFLLVGDPATGKTIFVQCLEKHLPNTVYVAGETARRGGFVERIVEGYRRYGKAFILMIDEVDKLDSDAVKTLHNLMEGVLDVPVSGKQLTVKGMRVMVIATSNRPEKIPESIMSRFGKPLVFKAYGRDEFIEVSRRVLRDEGLDEALAEKIATKLAELGVRDPRVARQVGRIVEDEEDVERAIRILIKE